VKGAELIMGKRFIVGELIVTMDSVAGVGAAGVGAAGVMAACEVVSPTSMTSEMAHSAKMAVPSTPMSTPMSTSMSPSPCPAEAGVGQVRPLRKQGWPRPLRGSARCFSYPRLVRSFGRGGLLL
jgi:hypothetical protein